MDPVTQGALGAAAAMLFAPKTDIRLAALIGATGGMLADADVLIRSAADPLLFIEYHRHFTHSLAFIPFGGLICALVFWSFLKSKLTFGLIYLYATIGYATHGVLDACTSYGTRLLWPFTDDRVAWNIVAVIDPLVTIPLLVGIAIACWKRNSKFARIGFSISIAYLLFGVAQRERAESALVQLAQSRGHASIDRLTAKPTMGNLILWRGIYRHEGQFHVDAIRAPLFQTPKILSGSTTPAIEIEPIISDLGAGSVLANDIVRFHHFSDSYLAWHPDHPDALCDVRYAVLPDSLHSLWGIRVDLNRPDEHAPYETFRKLDSDTMRRYRSLLFTGSSD